jgi:hypothetical protein
MALVTHEVSTPSTVNGTSYASGAFTPAVDKLLVVLVWAAGTTLTGSMSSTGAYTGAWTLAANYGTVNQKLLYVADGLTTSSVSSTVTFDCTGDAAAGCNLSVYSVSNMSKFGASAMRQIKNNGVGGSGGTTPEVIFDSAVLSQNPTIVFVQNATNPAGVTPPTNWVEGADIGFDTPIYGMETAARNNGFSGTTITWGSTSASTWTAFACEINSGFIASSGSYSLTGTASGLKAARKLVGDVGVYSLTGTAAGLAKGSKLVTDSGSYIIAGSAAALKANRRIAIEVGSYILTGLAATLTKSGGGSAVLIVDSGSYAVSGIAASLKADRKTSAISGVYDITGNAAALKASRKIASAAGVYTVSGIIAALKRGIVIAPVSGTYAVTGTAAGLKATRKLGVESGVYLVTGSAANVAAQRKIAAASGAYVLTGTAAALKRAAKLLVGSGAYVIVGKDALLVWSNPPPPATGWWIVKSPKRTIA